MVKLLPCDHEVTGSSPGTSLLQKCRERLRTKKTQVVGPFPGPCASGSYRHRAALFSWSRGENYDVYLSSGNLPWIFVYKVPFGTYSSTQKKTLSLAG